MKLTDFKFSEQDKKRDFVREEKIEKKIKFCLKYLVKHLPVNKLKKDNSFDFSKLKFYEGKNYKWYFLNNKETTILVRQYSTHFTFFVNHKHEDDYKSRLSVFTICDNRDKMDGNISDGYLDDNFQSIQKYLPQLVKLIEDNHVHCLWNPLSFERPDFTDVKIAMNGESVIYLDTLLFACDEIFSTYIVTYAQNEVLEEIKKYKVGDTFGNSYVITRVETEFSKDYSDPNYHGVGLEFTNNNFPDSKPRWADVYSIANYYSDDLYNESRVLERNVMDFVYKNHDKVMKIVTTQEKQDYLWMFVDNKYIEHMHNLYTIDIEEIEIKIFAKCINEEFRNFIKTSYNIKQKNN